MKHYNNDLTTEQQKAFNLKGESGAYDVLDIITPIVDITPKKLKNALVGNLIITNGSSGNILTANPNADIYIHSAAISVIKDVTSTSVDTSIQITQNGAIVRILAIEGITLTSQNQSVSCVFPHPIKIDRNTAIAGLNSTNVANIKSFYGITYTIDEQ